MLLSLAHVSFAHADAVPILTDVTYAFEPGWHGLVGPNGSGKTTLLGLLAGTLFPDRGGVRRLPHDLGVRSCPQGVEDLQPDIREFAEAHGGLASKLRGRLALDPGTLERWPSLSPGERKRWQVGTALAGDPEVLLLDEPTNHLDREGRALLLDVLARFRGIGVVVSHDRALLNALTAVTLRLDRGTLHVWSGGYDVARGLWEAEERRVQETYRAVRTKEEQLERRLAVSLERRAQAAAQMRTSKRMKGPRDSAARGAFKATRRRSAELLVSHDDALARRVTTTRWAIEDGRVTIASEPAT